MSESAERLNPDVLLRRLEQQEARERQGKLRIVFGFAPGVGNTYRMLQVARHLVIEHSQDVVLDQSCLVAQYRFPAALGYAARVVRSCSSRERLGARSG